jgi:hypothetical protein
MTALSLKFLLGSVACDDCVFPLDEELLPRRKIEFIIDDVFEGFVVVESSVSTLLSNMLSDEKLKICSRNELDAKIK